MVARRRAAHVAPCEPSGGDDDYSGRSFSFACGGWLKMYLFGVAKALQQCELERRARVIGCSAGALTATALALRCDFDAIRDYVLAEVVPKAHASWGGPFNVRQYLRATLAATGGLHQFEKLNDKPETHLTIVYSSLSAWKSLRVSRFDSQQHLTDALLASCCAPPIAGLPFKLKDDWVMDGGLLDFQPVLDDRTVTVSPFYCTGADIKPSRYVPMWWALFPPSPRNVEWLFDLGYEDGLAWILEQDLAGGRALVVPTQAASYDGDWTTTVGRVLGYHGVESRVLDALFLGLYVCLWRPLVFLCLYAELYTLAVVAGGKAAVLGAAAKLMVSCLLLAAAAVALSTLGFQHSVLVLLGMLAAAVFLGGVVLLCGGPLEAARAAAQDWAKCRSCLRNITSLSLFLRSLPGIGASFEIKRHEFLVRDSLVYRITLHFV